MRERFVAHYSAAGGGDDERRSRASDPRNLGSMADNGACPGSWNKMAANSAGSGAVATSKMTTTRSSHRRSFLKRYFSIQSAQLPLLCQTLIWLIYSSIDLEITWRQLIASLDITFDLLYWSIKKGYWNFHCVRRYSKFRALIELNHTNLIEGWFD